VFQSYRLVERPASVDGRRNGLHGGRMHPAPTTQPGLDVYAETAIRCAVHRLTTAHGIPPRSGMISRSNCG